MPTTNDIVRISLRMPRGLHDRAIRLAGRDRRSLNAELLYLIEHGIAAEELIGHGIIAEELAVRMMREKE